MQLLRKLRIRRGASLVEFSLAAVVFLALLFGIMDWAWVFFKYQTLVWHTSDAARWAAANDATNTTAIKNIVLCGTTTTCSGGGGMGFYTSANITAAPFSTTDKTDPTATDVGVVTRYFVKVTVSGYQITHFLPWFGAAFTGQPIIAVQPMECQAASSNCTYIPS